MRILKYVMPACLLLYNMNCCRTCCLNIIPVNPMAISTEIMIEKIDGVIAASINYYCEKGMWPSSKNDIANYRGGKSKINISDFKKMGFSKQSDKRLNINFDIYAFDDRTFHVEAYRGFCDIFIKDDKSCLDKNAVELYISDFIIYNKNSSDKKPIDIPTPIIIKFDDFNDRTISSIQHGYET